MLYLIVKAAISGIIIVVVSETAKRSPALGVLIASVPLVSVLAVIWLWRDTSDSERIAVAGNILVYTDNPTDVPSHPMLLRGGVPFWTSLVESCALTVVLYALTVWLLSKFGISL